MNAGTAMAEHDERDAEAAAVCGGSVIVGSASGSHSRPTVMTTGRGGEADLEVGRGGTRGLHASPAVAVR